MFWAHPLHPKPQATPALAAARALHSPAGGLRSARLRLTLHVTARNSGPASKHPGHTTPFVTSFGQRPGAGGSGGPANPPSIPANPPSARGGGDTRLNLLLSWADWRPASWVETLPPLLEPMGITSVRAQSAREAERIIRTTRVHIAVVDLSLPLDQRPSAATTAGAGGASESEHDHTGAGTRILELLRRVEAPPPTVVLKDPHFSRLEARHMHAALACNAFAVVDRASANAELMLKVLHRVMERYYAGRWPGCCPTDEQPET